MNSTETPGIATEERGPSAAPERPETPQAGAEPHSEGSPEAGTAAVPPRTRRRRRRRRRPVQAAGEGQAAASGEGSEAAEAAAGEPANDALSGEGGPAAELAAEAAPARPVLRLRNRRRRRRPAAPGLLPGPSDAASPAEGATPADAGSPENRPTLAPGQRSFSVPRRRRRHAPLAAAPTDASSGEPAAEPGSVPGQEAAEPGSRPPRPRTRRRRRAAAGPAAGEGAPDARGTRDDRSSGPRQGRGPRSQEGDRPEGGQRDRRDDRRAAGPRDRRDRPPGRGRAGPPRKVEQKLYSVDAVVDRGFEDVESEGETRRVHWTILKRTTADLVSRKPVAAVYVLQRDGSDTEFPNLGAARSAVNKTIVHPEKLTPSKAEHAAAKK